MSFQFPSSVEIVDCVLTNKNQNASLKIFDQIVTFDIWEDVSKPTMYAEITITDFIDLLNKFPLIGEEEIELAVKTTTTPITKFKFKIFEICNISKTSNGRGLTYTIKGVSKEHFLNGVRYVSKAYTGMLSDIVPQVLSEYLNSDKPIVVDQSKGIQTLVVPRLTPFSFIDMCRLRAVSGKYASSAYVFFENQDGFHFKTIEGLIEDGLANIGSKVFQYRLSNTLNMDKNRYSDQYRSLQSFEIVQNNDSIERLTLGTFKALTKTFDIATKSFTSKTFDIRSELDKYKFPNKTDKLSSTFDFIKEYDSETPLQFFRFIDSSVPDNFIDTSMAIRNSYKNLLNTSFVRVKTHGDTTLKAGAVIKIDIPVSSGFDERKLDEKSGNYLILRLRHMFSGGLTPTHEIVMDCTKVL
jgi:hypothetical protein